jgi:hypothetical protein
MVDPAGRPTRGLTRRRIYATSLASLLTAVVVVILTAGSSPGPGHLLSSPASVRSAANAATVKGLESAQPATTGESELPMTTGTRPTDAVEHPRAAPAAPAATTTTAAPTPTAAVTTPTTPPTTTPVVPVTTAAPAPAPAPTVTTTPVPSVASLVAEVEAGGIDPGPTWTWTMGDTATRCGAIPEPGIATGCTSGAAGAVTTVFAGTPTLSLVAHEVANAETENDAVPSLVTEVSAAEAGSSWSPIDAVASCLVVHFMGFQDDAAGTWQCPSALASSVAANIHDARP